MAVSIDYKASVEKDLRKLDKTIALRLLRKVEEVLGSQGRQGEALTGEFAGLFPLRVGDYRVIYARTLDGYLVLRIGHRRDVYRK